MAVDALEEENPLEFTLELWYNSWIWLKISSQSSLLFLELLFPVQDYICSDSLHCTVVLGCPPGQDYPN